jgi:hypothetical protein
VLSKVVKGNSYTDGSIVYMGARIVRMNIMKLLPRERDVGCKVYGVSKRVLRLWESIQIYAEDIHNVLKCHNVAKYCKFDARVGSRI